jgi:hypothetical protein
MPITNDAQLMGAISDVASNVVYSVSGDMLQILYDDIMKYTYEPLPNVYYWNGKGDPTFQFLEAFQLSGVKKNLNEIVTELFYNWENMEYDPGTYLHGSPFGGDMRERLAEILNVDGTTGFSNKMRQPYWDIFIKEMFDDGGIEKLFDKYMTEEFRKIGITIIKG